MLLGAVRSGLSGTVVNLVWFDSQDRGNQIRMDGCWVSWDDWEIGGNGRLDGDGDRDGEKQDLAP